MQRNPVWERTWKEREETLEALFGVSQPPGSPTGYVISLDLSWPKEWPDLVIPAACVQVFRPDEARAAGPSPTYDWSDGWLYLTLGISQPIEGGGPADVGLARADSKNLSGYGAEFGVMLPTPQPWLAGFLRWLMGYVCREAPVRGGHRIPFGFHELQDRSRSYFVGPADEFKVTPLDQTAAMLFWPMLSAPGSVVTSTGEFELLIGTTITADELAMVKKTSSGHLMLLLWLAGVKQRTIFGRPSVTADPRWEGEWSRIALLSYEQVTAELRRLVGGR